MMNSTPKSQRKKIITTLIVLFILSILVYVYRDSRPVLVVQGAFQSFFNVPKSVIYALGKKENDKRIADLTQKNRELTQKLVDFELTKKDNDALRSQFATSGAISQNLVAAKIIGFQGERSSPTFFIINAGLKDSIKSGMSVIFQKYLIGKVITVTQDYSVVSTILNQKFQVLAKLPETNANGILIGKNDFMLFDGVVITDSLKKDGVIVTKGEIDKDGVGVVPDMIIGKIVSISKNETAPFQSAQVMPLLDLSKLTDVFVISQM